MKADRARSFGKIAEEYDRLRSGYPAAAVAAVLPAGAGRVVDVGAGTGKLTAALLETGAEVIAVEPDEAMRGVLARRYPDVERRDGTAEHLPVPDASVDAVVYGQAWHWTDPPRAAVEAARVLRPGGTLGMLWNADDASVPWVDQLQQITDGGARALHLIDPEPLEGFAPGERTDVPWTWEIRRDDLVALTRTWSKVSTLPAAEQDAVVGRVRALLDTPAVLDQGDPVALPQICVTWVYRLAG